MSIPVLTQVYDEVRRLSIAGSVVAGGDFRLKKLAPPLEQAGQKAPVFAKVAQAVNKVVESNDKTSAEALLELSTLVNAIHYTQGETGLEGKLEPIETIDLGQQQTQASARVLKPLLEALTTTGSGRLEIIKDAFQRGSFRDLRLVKPALAALDDNYSEISEFVGEKVLPLYGKAILPELQAKFDQKGRGGHVRRLALMHQLDPEGTREIVKRALDEGSKEVKVVAIECLDPRDGLSFLLEQSKAKAKDVREAALKALAKSDDASAVQALQEALKGNDLELAVEPVQSSANRGLLKFVLDEAAAQQQALLASKEKDKKEAGKQVTRFLLLLECLRQRDDSATERFLLDSFGRRDELAAVKSEPGGKDIRLRLISIMARGSKKSQQALVDAHASLPVDELPDAFFAACRSRKPGEVFELFSPYLLARTDDAKKTKGNQAGVKGRAIAAALSNNWRAWQSRWYVYEGHAADEEDLLKDLDARWLDVAVRQKHLELTCLLARPGHAAASKLLSEAFDELLKKSKDSNECGQILETIVRIQHPAATDSLIAAIEKHTKSGYNYGLYWLCQLIPQLPKEAIPKLEALLPTLPEKTIDQLVDYVTQLKSKP
jgi:hypothetical protein